MGIPVPILMGAGIGAAGGLLKGGLKGGLTGGLMGGVTGGATKMMPAMNGLAPAKALAAESVPNFLAPTMPEIGGANLYSSGVAPAIPDASIATPLMTSTAPEAGGLKLMPGEHDWMKGYMPDLGAVQALGGGQQPQQQAPSAPSGGMSKGTPPTADAIAQLIASTKIPERQKRMNLFWS